MYFASFLAAEYAATTFPDDFKINVKSLSILTLPELINLKGVRLPWENRSKINIYIAAPNFEYVDKHYLNQVESSLIYHNFKPRFPVRENGLISETSTKLERRLVFDKDYQLLKDCQMLLAVLLYDDPGTLVEIGVSKAMGKPTLIYDPYNRAKNCFLTELPDLISNNFDEILENIFEILSDGE